DHHSPLVRSREFMFLPQGLRLRRVVLSSREIGVLSKLRQGCLTDQVPAGDRPMFLCLGDGNRSADRFNFNCSTGVESIREADKIDVRSLLTGYFASSFSPIPGSQRNRPVCLAGQFHYRYFDTPVTTGQAYNITVIEAVLLCRDGAEAGEICPRRLGDWVGEFLKPCIICETTIEDVKRRLKDNNHAL